MSGSLHIGVTYVRERLRRVSNVQTRRLLTRAQGVYERFLELT